MPIRLRAVGLISAVLVLMTVAGACTTSGGAASRPAPSPEPTPTTAAVPAPKEVLTTSPPAAAPSLSPSSAPSTATFIPVLASPTRVQPTPEPSATATPAALGLVPPLVVDSEAGRLYVSGSVNGVQQIVALAASDGHLLATYGITGTFDVDPSRGWLYVDRNESGIVILDAQTGQRKAAVSLPSSQQRRVTYPAPHADPAMGQVLAFRDNRVYVVDPVQGEVVETIAFDVPKDSDCRTLAGPLPIEWAVYDGARRLLYLDFTTYVCTPWIGETLVSYDLNAGAEIVRQGVLPSTATAFDGSLYGSSWYRMGVGRRWVWRDGQPEFGSEGWANSAPLFVDATRGRVYESTAAHGLPAFDAATMSLLFTLPRPVEGDLAGYDPGTDQLYYLAEGRLIAWPVSAVHPASPETPQVADPPARPVGHLVLSPTWSQDETLFGVWDVGWTSGTCYVFGVQGGLLYLSADSGETWVRPRSGLRGGCERISALAVSPDYAADGTLFAAVVGKGVFRSTDGGHLWRPSSTGMRSMSVADIFVSPGFGSDGIVFARSRALGQGNLYRSTDGGATWQALGVDVNHVALSPEFDRDGTLMATATGEVRVSFDGGLTWEAVGHEPDGDSFTMLSLAPLFDRWQVAFAFGGSSHSLYRSTDGGRSWQAVLAVGGHAGASSSPQLAYGPETDRGRLLFFLASETDRNVDPPVSRGSLYRSQDGGVTWEALALPADLVPTALAISPTFDQDGLVWFGTADGQVMAVEAKRLHGES